MKSIFRVFILLHLSIFLCNCSNNKFVINFEDKNDWLFVKRINSEELFNKFILIYGNSPYADSARLAIDRICFASINPSNIVGFQKYLDRFPTGHFVKEVKHKRDSLNKLGFLPISKIGIRIRETYSKCDTLNFQKSIFEKFKNVFNLLDINVVDDSSKADYICEISVIGEPKGAYYEGNEFLYTAVCISLKLEIFHNKTIVYSTNVKYVSHIPSFTEYNETSHTIAMQRSPCNAPYLMQINSQLNGLVFIQFIKKCFGLRSLALYLAPQFIDIDLYKNIFNSNEIKYLNSTIKYINEHSNVDKINPFKIMYYKEFEPSDEFERNFKYFNNQEFEKCNFWFLFYFRTLNRDYYEVDLLPNNHIILTPDVKTEFNIYKLNGENVYSEIISTEVDIDLSKAEKGIYIICLDKKVDNTEIAGLYYDLFVLH